MRKYAILRRQSTTGDGGKFRGTEALGEAARPLIAYEQLSYGDAASVAADPSVEVVAPTMPTALIRPFAGSSSVGADAWGLEAVGALSSQFTGRGVTVAVLDTGIDSGHPAFEGVAIEQCDFSGDGDGDRQGHGTHCAGTIFGRDVAGVRIGVARGVERALVGKVLRDDGGGDSEMIFQGMQWALSNGANVIFMSIGFDFPGMVAEQVADNWPADLAVSNALEAYRGNLRMFDAIMQLARARGPFGGGAVVVAAAGNESRRMEHPDWTIAASLPAAAEDVVSVAAVGRQGFALAAAPFSNSMATLCAPGVDILSARTGGGLETMSGTSMACPHVAGVAALWWEAVANRGRKPAATNVVARLIGSARNDVFGVSYREIDMGQGLATSP